MDERVGNTLRALKEEDSRDRVDGTPRHLRLRSVTTEVGQFLRLLVKLTGARQILEVGTSGGYSTIWLASAARETGGQVTTLELDATKIERAWQNFALAGLDDLVTVVEGDAHQTLGTLKGLFDFAFLDAEKEFYLDFLEPLVRLLRPGGVLVADNLLSHAEQLATFRKAAEAHPELECVLIPIPRGELVCRKRAGEAKGAQVSAIREVP
jgi:predicted O-methyltransferase YrrM